MNIHSPFACRLYIMLLLLGISILSGCSISNSDTTIVYEEPNQTSELDETDPTSMFDGENLGLWEQSLFFEGIYEQGNVYVKDGCIILEQCDWMTGIRWTGPYKTTNYEIYFEAMRLDGDDFFCTLTFPVGDDSCSLVLGGWGNSSSGISNINDRSANENETSLFFSLLDNTWYRVYLRVTDNRIQAWLDEVPLFNVDTTDKMIEVRMECEPSLPLGFATYMTSGAIRNIHYYSLPD